MRLKIIRPNKSYFNGICEQLVKLTGRNKRNYLKENENFFNMICSTIFNLLSLLYMSELFSYQDNGPTSWS